MAAPTHRPQHSIIHHNKSSQRQGRDDLLLPQKQQWTPLIQKEQEETQWFNYCFCDISV
jgi:hypothetical protein